MMKRFFPFIVFALTFITYHLSAQSVSEVMRNKDAYIYEIGYGQTEAEADKNALSQLVSRSARIVHSVSSVQEDKVDGDQSSYLEHFVETSSFINTIYLDDIGRHVLSDERGQKRVMRFVLRSDWEKRHDYCRIAIEQYIDDGKDAVSDSRPDDALRLFSWAYTLLQIYPNNDIVLDFTELSPSQYCYTSMKDILSNIHVEVIAVRKVSTSPRTHYPYEVLLDVLYKGEPVDYLTFSYFDGSMYVDGATVKDGRSSLSMTSLPEKFDFVVDCIHDDLARQLDPSVWAVISSPNFSLLVEGSCISVETLPDGVPFKKNIDTNRPAVQSVVKDKLEANASSRVAFGDGCKSDSGHDQLFKELVKSLSTGKLSKMRTSFTDEAWNELSSIVSSGNPRIIRTPECKSAVLDSLVMYRSIPVKLKFNGNRSFIEDVVFRYNDNTGKITSLAYALSAKTLDDILSMQWEDKARILLINFLEDYRTAYCLKDLSFIEKVFSDDAYIIVGNVLKHSEKKNAAQEITVSLGNEEIVYQTKSKKEYISDLRKSFRSKEFVNIRFEECQAAKGYGSKEGIYAVQLKQYYYSDNYADEGYLTLAIDMRDKIPSVKVRVWQEKNNEAYTAETMIERTVSTGTGIY